MSKLSWDKAWELERLLAASPAFDNDDIVDLPMPEETDPEPVAPGQVRLMAGMVARCMCA